MYHITTVEIMNEVALVALVHSLKSFALKHRTAEQRETLIGKMAPSQRGKNLLYMHKRTNRASSASVIWHLLSLVRIALTGLLAELRHLALLGEPAMQQEFRWRKTLFIDGSKRFPFIWDKLPQKGTCVHIL